MGNSPRPSWFVFEGWCSRKKAGRKGRGRAEAEGRPADIEELFLYLISTLGDRHESLSLSFNFLQLWV